MHKEGTSPPMGEYYGIMEMNFYLIQHRPYALRVMHNALVHTLENMSKQLGG